MRGGRGRAPPTTSSGSRSALRGLLLLLLLSINCTGARGGEGGHNEERRKGSSMVQLGYERGVRGEGKGARSLCRGCQAHAKEDPLPTASVVLCIGKGRCR